MSAITIPLIVALGTVLAAEFAGCYGGNRSRRHRRQGYRRPIRDDAPRNRRRNAWHHRLGGELQHGWAFP